MHEFEKIAFECGHIMFTAHIKPVSLQNKGGKRASFKRELQKITCTSQYIITGTCWISIDYHCQHVKREKNPGVYDIDNIIKSILDGMVGNDGVIIDDVIVDRVTVNWIDTPHDDYIQIEIEYPDLLFAEKNDLIFLISNSGWCFPSSKKLIEEERYIEMMKSYFATWEGITKEEDYYAAAYSLPIQNFIYKNKINDKGYEFVELPTANNTL